MSFLCIHFNYLLAISPGVTQHYFIVPIEDGFPVGHLI